MNLREIVCFFLKVYYTKQLISLGCKVAFTMHERFLLNCTEISKACPKLVLSSMSTYAGSRTRNLSYFQVNHLSLVTLDSRETDSLVVNMRKRSIIK